MVTTSVRESSYHACAPRSVLRGTISRVWASRPAEGPAQAVRRVELTLPAAEMHLVVRLDNNLVDIHALSGEANSFRAGAVGGLRTAAYVKRSTVATTVGAMVQPGMCAALLGIPAVEFAGKHVALADVWPASRLDRLRERLAGAIDAPEMAAIFEAALIEGLRPDFAPDAWINASLARLRCSGRITDVADASGVSHRHFIHRFREAVGVTPMQFKRLLRFERLTSRMAAPGASMASIAIAAGFADQAHMARDFRRFTGITISAYRARVGGHPRHVPAFVP